MGSNGSRMFRGVLVAVHVVEERVCVAADATPVLARRRVAVIAGAAMVFLNFIFGFPS